MAKLMKVRVAHSQNIGRNIPLAEGENTFRPSGLIHNEKAGERAVDTGYTTKEHSALLKLSVQSSIDPTELSKIQNDTITVDCGSGSYVMNGAYAIGDAPEIGDGTFSLSFASPTSTKI
ncbi:phage tail tube protein [Candidatus Haliotispira prima]|uniref:Phage tail tube protein n=1 Tax=Candidatus Haliotispira prima TaxID=3034016 RepID=A0ABY8MEH0_9SPIO|nr:phage tail tube protein [Candidatus Haliotispira prima]